MKRKQFIKTSAIIGMAAAVPALIKAGSGLLDDKKSRRLAQVLNTSKELVGTLPILRAFAGDHQDLVSPYVLFDEFGPVNLTPGSKPLRVDAHPHAGIIPTTYFLSGSGHHKDSLNYDFQIGKGDFMMFSSGRGAIHMEETGQKLYNDGGVYHGFQIWLNMPAKYKHSDPATLLFNLSNMGQLNEKDYSGTVVLGELNGAKSSVELLSPAFYYHLHLKPGCKLEIPCDPTHNAFVYVISGAVEAEEQREVKANQVALYERGESLIRLFAKDSAELLVLGGQPLDEPVYSYGPFVMNTEEEIRQCIRNYQLGRMGDPEAVNK